MAIIQICGEQVTSISETYGATVTCENPTYPPVGAGDECKMVVYNVALDTATSPMTLAFSYDVQFEYLYINQGTEFADYCTVNNQSGSIVLPSAELEICNCGLTPTYEVSYNCNPGAITTTPTMVQGFVNLAFTVSNLCTPTLFSVSTIDVY